MRSSLIVFVVMGATALLLAGAVRPRAGLAAPAPTGPSGAYAFSFSTHDPISGQEGVGVGTMVFGGAGVLSGVYSQAFRCPGGPCGVEVLETGPYTGTYSMQPNGSTILDFCVTFPTGETVRERFMGAFSNAFTHLRFIFTKFASPCDTGTLMDLPNVSSGTADKL